MAEAPCCVLCFSIYDDGVHFPLALSPCGHTLCKECFENPRLTRDARGYVLCPHCRSPSVDSVKVWELIPVLDAPLLALGLEGAGAGSAKQTHNCGVCDEVHPSIQRCIDCNQDMCEAMAQSHARMLVSKDHRIVAAQFVAASASRRTSVVCPVHRKRFELFDRTCGKVICLSCSLAAHKVHDVIELEYIVIEKRQELSTAVERCKANGAAIFEAEGPLRGSLSELSAKALREETKIKETIQRV
jgi:tripartite motif-containing protein 45